MNEELEKYTLELNEVQKAIGQVEGMIHTKEENVKGLQAQLDDLIEVREQIEEKISEREKEAREAENAENKPEMNTKEPDELEEKKLDVTEKESEKELKIEELYDDRKENGLRFDRLDGGLMKVVSGANKTRNGNIFQQMKERAAERAKMMPEEEIVVEEEKAKVTPIIEDEEISK